jgi:hypothetical protein
MSKATYRARIERVLDTAPEGLTCKQIERMTGVRHSTASAALSGLAAQGKVFRLGGFRKPYHWVTPGNLRGRPVLDKPVSKKDRLIHRLVRENTQLRTLLDYPTDSDTLSPEQDRAEQEQTVGTHA